MNVLTFNSGARAASFVEELHGTFMSLPLDIDEEWFRDGRNVYIGGASLGEVIHGLKKKGLINVVHKYLGIAVEDEDGFHEYH